MKHVDMVSCGWDDYELIDAGEGRKLERFGSVILDRPDPQALWKKTHPVEEWALAGAQFIWADKGERWSKSSTTPQSWKIQYQGIALELTLSNFKHIGVFPEHQQEWEILVQLGEKIPRLRMLNLFGYTGAASLLAASAGMEVTHVDASKQTLETLKRNRETSGLSEDSLRIICEDALKYAKRLIERGEQFEVVVMDPPAFGRGPKGELWKIEESLAVLVALVPNLLSSNAQMVILNGYAAGFGARAFGELLGSVLPTEEVTYGDVGIQMAKGAMIVPTGIYALWQKKE